MGKPERRRVRENSGVKHSVLKFTSKRWLKQSITDRQQMVIFRSIKGPIKSGYCLTVAGHITLIGNLHSRNRRQFKDRMVERVSEIYWYRLFKYIEEN